MTDVNGAITATTTAIDRTEQFAQADPRLQRDTARPLPRIPLLGPPHDRAVAASDKDLADHRYYPPTGP